MAKATKQELITEPVQTGELLASPNQVPAYMKEDVGAGLQELAQYVMPPMLKVVQKAASDALLNKFNVADVIVMPNQTLLYSQESQEPFEFVIVGFYVEFVAWNPIEAQAGGAIRERTQDPRSPLALKCKNDKTWSELMPKGKPDDKDLYIRNVEHLNYIVIIESDKVEPMPHIISFSRGEHKTGRKLANMVSMRRGPLYGARFLARASQGGEKRTNAAGKTWAGFDIENAPEPWVGEDKYNAYKKISEQFDAAMKANRVRADYDPMDVEDFAYAGDNAGQSEF